MAMNIGAVAPQWLVRAPGCPMKIIRAQNREEGGPVKPLRSFEVRENYERSFAKKSSEAFTDRDLEWPELIPITDEEISARGLQWLLEDSQVTGKPRGLFIVWQGQDKAKVVKFKQE